MPMAAQLTTMPKPHPLHAIANAVLVALLADGVVLDTRKNTAPQTKANSADAPSHKLLLWFTGIGSCPARTPHCTKLVTQKTVPAAARNAPPRIEPLRPFSAS